MKVLLTGARGFTAPYVRAELERAGHTVVGTVLGSDAGVTPGHGETVLDVRDSARCREIIERERPDYIVHLAGLAFANEVQSEPYYQVNLIGTENLLKACIETGHRPTKILLASSSTVYGIPTESHVELDESAPLRPVNHYAISKLAMEMVARTWFEKLPILVVRPFNYIGRGQALNFVTAKIVDHFRRRAPFIELGNLDVARDFSDVRDVAATYMRLIESDAHSEIVNVCSGTAHSLQYVIDTLEAYTGHTMEIRENPAFVRINDPKLVRGSAHRLEQLIGNRPTRTLDVTLRWMAQTAPATSTTSLGVAA